LHCSPRRNRAMLCGRTARSGEVRRRKSRGTGLACVLVLFALTDIGFLWYNVLGCALVTALALLFQGLGRLGPTPAPSKA
jgi:hypothetical protein